MGHFIYRELIKMHSPLLVLHNGMPIMGFTIPTKAGPSIDEIFDRIMEHISAIDMIFISSELKKIFPDIEDLSELKSPSVMSPYLRKLARLPRRHEPKILILPKHNDIESYDDRKRDARLLLKSLMTTTPTHRFRAQSYPHQTTTCKWRRHVNRHGQKREDWYCGK